MIKEGYKRTDLGIIPESWEIKELSKITSLITNGFVGKATDHYTTSEDGVLYIQGYNVDGFEFNFNGIKYVTKEFHLKNKKSILKKGDLLTIQTGDVGLTAYVPKELEGSNCHALIITRYIKDKAHSKFYHQYFNSIIGRYRLSRIETGSTMKHINCGDLKKLLIPIPPLPEQQAIANCLTTWDKGIETLSTLIAAKREQKKGLMQQLLTGKKRLKGFTGEWEEVKFKDIFERTNSKKHQIISRQYLDEGIYPVVDQGKTEITAYSNQIEKLYTNVPVIIFGDHTREVKYIDFDFIIGADGTQLLRNKKSDNIKYLYYLLKNTHIVNLGYSRHMRVLSTKRFIIPSLEEQNAIAHILTTADQEIALLEKKLEAMKEEKKGLMQGLLTGEKRLVESC